MTDYDKKTTTIIFVLVAILGLCIFFFGCSLFTLEPSLLPPPGPPSPPSGGGGALGGGNMFAEIGSAVGTVIALVLYRTMWYRKRNGHANKKATK